MRLRTGGAIGLILTLGCAMALHPTAAVAGSTSPAPRTTCADLGGLRLPATTFTSAAEVSGGTLEVPGAPPLTDLPPFCRMVAVVAPAINIEVWLPLRDWNRRFQGVGNGGTAGTISYSAMANALRAGYATASTDTGHLAGDTAWFTNQQQLEDHGFRSIHEMTLTAKALVRAFYRERLAYSYFNGCSTGGGQGFMEAQRFPTDYDGILSGAPNYRRTHLLVSHVYSWQVTHLDPAATIPPATIARISGAVLAQADAGDGVTDGVIENPLHITLDLRRLAADAGLSAQQATAVAKLYEGPNNPRTGERLFPGFVPGDEAGWGAILGDLPFSPATNVLRFAIFQDPAYDFAGFDFDDDVALLDNRLDFWNADSPDITAFENRGGKMLVYHGWSDWGITPRNTLDYHDTLVDFYRGHHRTRAQAEDAVGEFFRMFFVPGMGHCSGGAGTDDFDALTPLTQWVEHGQAPVRIPAAHFDSDGVVDRTRPLCRYPAQAIYTGQGSTDDQANFECQTVLTGAR